MQLPNNKVLRETGNGILNYPLFVRTILLQGQTKLPESSLELSSVQRNLDIVVCRCSRQCSGLKDLFM